LKRANCSAAHQGSATGRAGARRHFRGVPGSNSGMMAPMVFRSWRLRVLLPAALAAGVAAVTGLQAVPAEPAATLDLTRYLGRWYVIARAPAPGQARGAYFEYQRRADGDIDDIYSEREHSFDRAPVTVARTAHADPARPAKWSVRKGWLSTDEQWVLYVSPDYRYAIVGTPERGEGWILARDPVIPEWSYAGLLARLAMQGYDVSLFRRVPQKPEQIGRPGFE
jgi:apolipoprotein D and lipocalin family protein